MNLQTLIETSNPLAYWTFENFSQNNVYDEYNYNTLINNGCTLDIVGNPNSNYSDKCINLNGGYLIHNSTDFTNDILQQQDIIIQFTLKVESLVTGFRRIVSKWNPDQQYMIGFENGNLVAKIQTPGGLVELYCDRHDIIYSGRWLNVCLSISQTSITFMVNGYSIKDSGITSVSNTNITNISINSQFMIGDDTTPFSTDVLISDLSITRFLVNFDNTCYYLTRSNRDIVLDLQPEYYFPIADSISINRNKPIKNLGTIGSVNGYLKGSDINNFKLLQEDLDYYRIGVEIPVGGYFTIDDVLDLNFTTDHEISIFMFGNMGRKIYGYDYYYDSFNIFEFSSEKSSLNDYIKFSSGISRRFACRVVAYDASGTSIINTTFITITPPHINSGLTSIEIGKTQSSKYKFKKFAKYVGENFNFNIDGVNSWSPTSTGLKYNRFFKVVENDWEKLPIINSLILFNRKLTQSEYDILQMSRNHIHLKYFKSISDKHFRGTIGYDFGGVDYDDYRVGSDFTNDKTNIGYFYNNDPLNNKPNAIQKSFDLQTTTSHISRSDFVQYNLSNNNFIFGCYLYNKNTTSRYCFMALTRYFENPNETLNNHFCSVWANSYNGGFKEGCVEVQIGINSVVDTIQSSSEKLLSLGFHHIAVLRNGNMLELWIDGELDSFIVTSTIISALSNTTINLFGGDCAITLPFFAVSDDAKNELPKNTVEYLFWGFPNLIQGKTTLDFVGVQSKLVSLDAVTGNVLDSDSTKVDGSFEFMFEKDEQEHEKFILAQPIDTNITNNIIVHGPYKPNTVYSKLKDESFTQTLSEMVMDFSPIAYYKMDEVSGSTVVSDSSGNGINGVISGSDYKLNQSGPNNKLKSIYFGGVDDFIDISDGFSDFTNGITIEAFVRKISNASNHGIVEFGTSSSNYNNGISLSGDTTGNKYRLMIKDGSSNDLLNVNGGTSDSYIWEHVVFRIDPDLNVTLWENGLNTYSGSITSMPPNISRTVNYIGRAINSGSFFNGYLSNVAIYNYAIPEEEINKHAYYAFSSHVTTLKSLIINNSPQYYWTFDRLRGLVDEQESLSLSVNGSYVIDKNSIVLNRGTIANNYLYSTTAKVNSSLNNKWTLEISFKSLADQSAGILVSEWNSSTDSGTFSLKLESNGSLKLYLVNGTSFIPTALDYTDGKWHHIVIRVDDNFYEIFVDGVLAGSASSSNTFGQYNLTIGNDSTGDVSTYLDVETHIDDFAIYDGRLLTNVEIEEHYNQFIKKKNTL